MNDSDPARSGASRDAPTPTRARWSPTRSTTSPRTCRSWRCSTCSTSSSSCEGDDPVAFDHDCREGICGMCGLVINGVAHGPQQTTTCQLHMRSFKDGDTIDIEPWRAGAVPGDQGPGRRPRRLRPDHPGRRLHLRADRHRPRRARHAGAQDATPTPPSTRPPASAAAPAWRPARTARRCCSPPRRSPTSACCRRASPSATPGWSTWSRQQDDEGFGGCTNIGECTAVCPKGIPLETISRLNRDLLGAMLNPQS